MSKNNPIEDLQEIRKMMEDSSKFLSLSGLSGVFAGVVALLGALTAHLMIKDFTVKYMHYFASGRLDKEAAGLEMKLVLLAAAVLVLAIGGGILITGIKAKKSGQKLFSPISFRLLRSIMVPLSFGGIFIVGLYYHNIYLLIPPAMLVFYGMALLNASKYVHVDIKFLALSQMILGCVLIFIPQYGLLFWAMGFGIMHILYGTIMYFKYDRKKEIIE